LSLKVACTHIYVQRMQGLLRLCTNSTHKICTDTFS